jgi:hypothetical protein
MKGLLLILIFISFVTNCFGQAAVDQFPKHQTLYGNKELNYYPYRSGELWGYCDSAKKVLVPPIFDNLPNIYSDRTFYYVCSNCYNNNPDSIFTYIYNKSFKFLLRLNGFNEVEKYSNSRYRFGNFVLDSAFNVLFHHPNLSIGRDDNEIYPVPIYTEEYFSKEQRIYTFYNEKFEQILRDTLMRAWVAGHHRYQPLYGCKNDSVAYLYNFATKKYLHYGKHEPEQIGYPATFFVINHGNHKTIYNRQYDRIMDSLKEIKELGDKRLLVKKTNSYYVLDSVGKIQFKINYDDVYFKKPYFFCPNQNGTVTIIDSIGKTILLSGNVPFFGQGIKEFIQLNKKFIVVNHKLAIANEKDSVLICFKDFDDLPLHTYLEDTLFNLTQTTFKMVKQKNGKYLQGRFFNYKLISINNIDYTPKNVDSYVYYKKGQFLGTKSGVLIYKNHKQGLLSPLVDTLLPPVYSGGIHKSNYRNVIYCAMNNPNQTFIYDVKKNKLSDTGFNQVKYLSHYSKTHLVSFNAADLYTDLMLDSNFILHQFEKVKIKMNSIIEMPIKGKFVALGINKLNGKNVLCDESGNIVCELPYFNFTDNEGLECKKYNTNTLSVEGKMSHFSVFFNYDLIALGINSYANLNNDSAKSVIFYDYDFHSQYYGSIIYQVNYRNKKVISFSKTNCESAKKTMLFVNQYYDSCFQIKTIWKSYFVFIKDTVSYLFDTSGVVLFSFPSYGVPNINFDTKTVSIDYYDSIYTTRKYFFKNKFITSVVSNPFQKFGSSVECTNTHLVKYITTDLNDKKSCGIFNFNGDTIVPFKYSYLYSHNLYWNDDSVLYIAQESKTKKFGLINLKNQIVLPFEYDSVLPGIGIVNVLGFIKNKEVYEFNVYNYQLSKLDTVLKNYNIGYRIDVGLNGLLGIKDMRGNLVVKHKYNNIYRAIEIPRDDLYYTLREITLKNGSRKMIKNYFDIHGTEFWKD